MKIDRLLSIIVILLNREKITAKELSSRFEVSIRTIYRDIDAINLAGIPIVSLQGSDGGFGIMDTFTLKRHLFTFEDMMGTIAALKGINKAIGDRSIDDTIEKFRNMIPDNSKTESMFAADELIMDIAPWGCRIDIQPLFKKMYGAIRSCQCVDILYTGNDLVPARRIIEPMSLVFKGHAWYLYGFCRLKKGYRLFKLSRISSFNILEELFIRRKDEYSRSAEFKSPADVLDVVLRFPAVLREKFEDFFSAESFFADADGMTVLRASMPDEPWLVKMILSFDGDVEIVSPESLRRKTAMAAERIFKRYSS